MGDYSTDDFLGDKGGREEPITPEELDRWAAESIMGWTWRPATASEKMPGRWYDSTFPAFIMSANTAIPIIDWHPSDPNNGQIWLVINKMLEKKWYLTFHNDTNDEGFRAEFYGFPDLAYQILKRSVAYDPNPSLAILKAARAALKENNNGPISTGI